MTLFVLGLAVFFSGHLWTALAREQRAALIKKVGAGPFKGMYSLVALAGFAMIVIGWRGADASAVYSPPAYLRHVTYLLVLIAFICLASAYLPKGKIAAAVKHPMLAGVKLWAFGHLLSNGEVRSILLFGSFLAFAVIDRIVVKRRNEPTPTAGPFANDLIAIAVGAGAWAAVYFFLHRYIAGVPLTP